MNMCVVSQLTQPGQTNLSQKLVPLGEWVDLLKARLSCDYLSAKRWWTQVWGELQT